MCLELLTGFKSFDAIEELADFVTKVLCIKKTYPKTQNQHLLVRYAVLCGSI